LDNYHLDSRGAYRLNHNLTAPGSRQSDEQSQSLTYRALPRRLFCGTSLLSKISFLNAHTVVNSDDRRCRRKGHPEALVRTSSCVRGAWRAVGGPYPRTDPGAEVRPSFTGCATPPSRTSTSTSSPSRSATRRCHQGLSDTARFAWGRTSTASWRCFTATARAGTGAPGEGASAVTGRAGLPGASDRPRPGQ
jgi:hypothetical protein